MKKIKIIVALTICQFFIMMPVSADNSAVDKPVKIAIKAIQIKKYELASQQLDYDAMSKIVMGKYWDQMTVDQQKELTSGVETLINRISFTKGTEMFKHLSTIHYGKPSIQGSKAKLKTTIVVYQSYKKTEIVINFELIKKGSQWKIVETTMMGEPILGGIHMDEIRPLVNKGGIEAVMNAVRKKISQVK